MSDTPGPGMYAIDSPIRPRTSSSTGFGTSRRSSPSPERQTTPGPGSYGTPNGWGKQSISTRRSSASATLGKGTRDQRAKVSAPGVPGDSTAAAPGPGTYRTYSSIGKQGESRYHSSSSPGIGTSARPSPIKPGGRDVPGPGQYPAPTSFGAHRNKLLSSSPAFSLSYRPTEKQLTLSLGPGEYTPENVTSGNMVSSRRSRSASYSFGTSTRDQAQSCASPGVKPTINKDASRIPGPGHYPAPSSLGKQGLSINKNLPSVAFGIASRDSSEKIIQPDVPPSPIKTAVPGPGAYPRNDGSIGKQVVSRRRSSPGYSFGTSVRPDTPPGAPG